MKIAFVLIAMLLMAGCAVEISSAVAIEAMFNGSLTAYLESVLVAAVQANPHYTLVMGATTVAMPVIGWLANRTDNPIDNAIMIGINKVVQTLAMNSSRNQPNVLSWKQMLTNKPSTWPALLRSKMSVEGMEFMKGGIDIRV